MNPDLDSDVLVVGAGPVGLTLTTDLAQRGVAVTVDRKSTRLNSSHSQQSRMPSSA